MANKDLLASRLAELSDRFGRVRMHAPASATQLAANRDALDLVSFNLMLAVQICSDIASHLIADERWPVADTLGRAFERLTEYGVIESPVADALKKAVGLRNVVAHGYTGIDVELCHRAATSGLSDWERFVQQVSAWAGR